MTVYWNDKFADLPVIQLSSFMYPKHDGDIAELEHLADAIFDAQPVRLPQIPPYFLWFQTIDKTGIDPDRLLDAMSYAAMDRAAGMLQRWRDG